MGNGKVINPRFVFKKLVCPHNLELGPEPAFLDTELNEQACFHGDSFEMRWLDELNDDPSEKRHYGWYPVVKDTLVIN